MIPFNTLGFFFHHFSKYIYPLQARTILDTCVLTLPDHASILDVGGGTGVLSRFAYRRRPGLRYVSIDPAPGMMQYAPGYLELHEGCAEALPFEDESFDMLMLGESLHHLNDHAKAFDEFRRVLKTNGLLYVFEFNPNHRRGKVIQKAEAFLGEPAQFVSPETLKQKLYEFGFESHLENMGWKYVLSATLKHKERSKHGNLS